MIIADSVSVAIDHEYRLQPMSFEIQTGTAVALVGPNGSGKTTLLRLIAGITQATSGTITLNNSPIDERNPHFRSHVAAMIGTPPLARDLTLHEHLVLVGASWGFTVAEARNQADNLLNTFDIHPLARRFPHELSSGQTQLVTMALTLARTFDVLLLDEPEQRLDSDRLLTVCDILRRLVSDGKTLIFASHNTVMIERVATNLLTIAESQHGQTV